MNGTFDPFLAIPHADRQLYEAYFAQLRTRDGFVDSQTAREFFSKSPLSKSFLADMWFRADQNRDGRLDKMEFCVAMHIITTATRSHLSGASNGTAQSPFGMTCEERRRSSPSPRPEVPSTPKWDPSSE